MTKNRQPKYQERAFLERDFDALVEIEKSAGAARWNKIQLEYFTEHPHIDTRLIYLEGGNGEPIAFYVVEHGEEVLYLSNLAVVPEWRRRGVASFALEKASELGRGLNYKKLALDVQEENLGAQLLYRKCGFRATKIKYNHYGSQDGYYMVKDIRLTRIESN